MQEPFDPAPQTWHFAVAYALIRSKPEAQDLHGWLTNLRDSLISEDDIVSARSVSDVVTAVPYHGDTDRLYGINEEAYYRRMYMQAQFEIQKLQRKVVEQQAEIEKRQQHPLNDVSGIAERRVTHELYDYTNQKQQINPTHDPTANKDDQNEIMNISRLCESDETLEKQHELNSLGNDITTNICLARLALHDSPIDRTSVLRYFTLTITAVKDMFAEVFDTSNRTALVEYFASVQASSKLDSHATLETNLRYLRRTCQIVLMDLLLFPETTSEGDYGEILVLIISDFISDVLTLLSDHSRHNHETHSEKSTKKQQEGGKKLCSWLTAFAREILHELRIGNSVHFRLFEAITYLVFQRAGTLLYILHFGHERSSTLEEEILQDQHYSLTGQSTAEMHIARAETSFILPLVQKIKDIAPYHYASPAECMKDRHHTAIPKRRGAKLSVYARKRLEHTLVQCIWNGQYDTFMEVIQRPERRTMHSTSLEADVQRGMNTGTSSFTAEIWKLFAWDMLSEKHFVNS